MASAQYVANFPSTEVSAQVGNVGNLDGSTPYTGSGVGSHILKFFTGYDESQAYQNALTANNRAYEQAMLRDARNYETWYDSTAVQRRVADIKAAGLNPWLALQSGGIGANGSSASSTSPSSGSSAKSNSSTKNHSSSLAMLLLSTARLIAALG